LLRRSDGRTLLEAQAAVLRRRVRRLAVAAPAERYRALRTTEPAVARLEWIEDPGLGPGVAVQAASARLSAPWLLWAVTDAPAPHGALVMALQRAAESQPVDAVVVRRADRRQVGFVLARRAALPTFRCASLQGLLRGREVVELDAEGWPAELRAALDDVDEPDDLSRRGGSLLAPGLG